MKLLITGCNGFLGQHLTVYLARQGFDVYALGRGECRIAANAFKYVQTDLLNDDEVQDTIKNVQPEVIVHAAALSKPDECEQNKPLCLAVNVEATERLLRYAIQQERRPFFIYVSTDFVFGENGPHGEDELPEPLNFYGQSKLMAEEAVKQSGLSWSIMRPVFIYGEAFPGMRGSFLHWVKNNVEQGKQIKVVNDQMRTPTYVIDICRGLEAMINHRAEGVFHLAGKDILSPYNMAIKVAAVLQLDASLIESVTAETFKEPVRRSKRSGLKIYKAMVELGYQPLSFDEGIKATFKIL